MPESNGPVSKAERTIASGVGDGRNADHDGFEGGDGTAAAIESWLRELVPPGSLFEIRACGGGTTLYRQFTATAEAAEWAAAIDGERKGTYVTLNPLDPELPASRRAAGDADVLRRLWLLVDCDPVRAAGTSATEEEKALAMELAAAVRGWLRTLGWPSPVLADSANGAHLDYAIELPSDAAARDLVQAVLEALARRFDTPRVKIDTSVFNASRICKLYGTLTCKGEDAPERPHRRSRVLEVPRPVEVVSRDLLEALAVMGKPEPGAGPGPRAEPDRAPRAATKTKTKAKAKDETTTWVGKSTADDYAARADWAEILGPHGWRVEKEMPDGEVRGTRPGKPPKEGCSATTDHDGRPVFKVYSDEAAPFAKGGAYSKFQAYALLEHAGDESAAARALYAAGYGTRPPAAAGPKTERDVASRPYSIRVNPEWSRVKAEAIAALATHPNVYRRGAVLVQVVAESRDERRMTKKTTLRHTANAPGVYPLEPVTARVLLTERASLFKLLWDGHPDSKPEAIPCGPPDWLGGAIVKAKHWPDVRELLAIAECPYPRADGTIVTAAGYDPETGILHCPSIALPDLPDAPTRETARAAADRILAHFEQFPFAAPADKAAFLASLLTHVARPTIDGPVPGFAFNGNKAGTGKGLLVDAIGVITTGRPAAAMDYPEKEEAAKVLTSLALAGTPAVHFDNLPSGATYGGSALDRGLTARTVDGRILGQSATTGPIRLRLCWDLTGNNLSPGYDAYRRWIPVNLKSSFEAPEMRGDVKEKDLRSYLLKHRGTILRDVLTIFRAHALAGRPAAADSRMGSFEAWDATVRGAVTFAIGTDPLKTLRAAAEEAPERLDRLALIQAWRTLPGGERPGDGLTAAEAGKLAAPDRESGVSKYPVYLRRLAAARPRRQARDARLDRQPDPGHET
jgi:hypothetical protein